MQKLTFLPRSCDCVTETSPTSGSDELAFPVTPVICAAHLAHVDAGWIFSSYNTHTHAPGSSSLRTSWYGTCDVHDGEPWYFLIANTDHLLQLTDVWFALLIFTLSCRAHAGHHTSAECYSCKYCRHVAGVAKSTLRSVRLGNEWSQAFKTSRVCCCSIISSNLAVWHNRNIQILPCTCLSVGFTYCFHQNDLIYLLFLCSKMILQQPLLDKSI